MASKFQLLVIDGQFDFCDPTGSLYVPGAEMDMKRLASMIKNGKEKIDTIWATMDTHKKTHIANPIWWIDKNGKHPNPFTSISYEDVIGANPNWRAHKTEFQKLSVDYVKALKENGRYTLTIWPPHCLIGSNGHKVFPDLYEAFSQWEDQFLSVDYILKGLSIFTEHYSALKADVIDEKDPLTTLNKDFLNSIKKANMVGIAGEALSHCVANTVRDIIKEIGEDQASKFVILEDATSPVTGFEDLAREFIDDMKKIGMKISKTSDFLG